MLGNQPHLAYRFVVLFRREPREVGGAAEEWRGWVCRVPNALEEVDQTAEQRVWFRELRELPDLIRALMNERRTTYALRGDQAGGDS